MLSIASAPLGLAAPVMSTNADAPIKLGVNGFGRIGRQVVRIAMDREAFVLKHINSPMSPEYMKYLLEHDTIHGRFPGTCEVVDGGLSINGLTVSLSSTRDPTEIPWEKVHRASDTNPTQPILAAPVCARSSLLKSAHNSRPVARADRR